MQTMLYLRKKLRLTQKDVADQLGISRQAYANYETGKREPDIGTIVKLAKYFDVSIECLLGVSDTPSEAEQHALDVAKYFYNEEKPADEGELSENIEMRIIENKFSIRFRNLRKGAGLTQELFLKHFNKKYNRSFTAAAVSQYENGKRIPEIDALMDFADFFGVSIDYLLGNSDIPALNQKPADEGELSENVVIYHRDGKTVRRTFSKAQLSMISAMLDAIPDEDGENTGL